jgi:hypothetical protein
VNCINLSIGTFSSISSKSDSEFVISCVFKFEPLNKIECLEVNVANFSGILNEEGLNGLRGIENSIGYFFMLFGFAIIQRFSS